MRLLILPAVAILIVAGALAVVQPWQGDEGQEATAGTREFALCNVAVTYPRDSKNAPGAWDGEFLAMQIRERGPAERDLPDAAAQAKAASLTGVSNVIRVVQGHGVNAPSVYLDAESGEYIVGLGPAAIRAELRAELAAMKVRRLSPEEKSWPYRDVGPVVAGSRSGAGLYLHWRKPDPMSGLQALHGFGDAFPPASGGESLTLQGCKSTRTLVAYYDGSPNKIFNDNVAPEDRAAFDAFFAAVEVRKP